MDRKIDLLSQRKPQKRNSIVWCDQKAVKSAIYGLLNMFPSLGVSVDKALYFTNVVYSGTNETEKNFFLE